MLNQKTYKSPLPIFSPDLTLNSQIRLFYAEKWILLKKLGTLLKIPASIHVISFFTDTGITHGNEFL